jgi:hypothetical protein
MWRKEDVIQKLREDQAGRPLREYAECVGCSTSAIAQFYNGTREPSDKILDHLNLEREIVVVYRPKRRWK